MLFRYFLTQEGYEMEFKIKTISPVHIGSGVDLQPYEYTLDNGYHRYNMPKLFRKIGESYPNLIEKMDAWIAEYETKQRGEDSKDKSVARLNLTFKNFLKNNGVAQSDVDRIMKSKDVIMYSFDLPFSVSKRKKLKEMIKNQKGKAYIPGTSLKGAIRTALASKALNQLTNGEVKSLLKGIPGSNIEGLNRILSDFKKDDDGKDNSEKLKKIIGDEVEKILFYLGFHAETIIIFGDEKFDLMKALLITDTYNSEANMTVAEINPVTNNKSRNISETSIDPQPISLFEILESGSQFNCRIEVDIGYLYNLYNMRKDLVGAKEKIERLFGFDISLLKKKDFKEYEQKAIEHIKAAVYEFSKEISQKDLLWLKRFREKEVLSINPEMKKINDFINQNRFLLRIGYASGFHSTTVALSMAKNIELKTFFETMVKKFKIGVPPKLKRSMNESSNFVRLENLPTSRRLVTMISAGSISYSPLGWIELIF